MLLRYVPKAIAGGSSLAVRGKLPPARDALPEPTFGRGMPRPYIASTCATADAGRGDACVARSYGHSTGFCRLPGTPAEPTFGC